MITVILGLVGAAVFGASDFFGGLAAKGTSAIKVTAINSATGFAVLLIASLFIPTRWSSGALLTGLVAGIAGAIALGLLYACLAMGPMSILSPIMALTGAIVPIAVGLGRGEQLSALGYLGIAVGLVAVLLICFVPGRSVVRPRPRAILMAIGAGAGIGCYLVAIDASPADSGPAPLIACFFVTGIVMGAVLLVQRIRSGVSTPLPAVSLRFALLCGLTDGIATFLFLLALRSGDLSVVAVLNALVPGGTIVLAAIVLKERIGAVQYVGLVVALGAAALLALA